MSYWRLYRSILACGQADTCKRSAEPYMYCHGPSMQGAADAGIGSLVHHMGQALALAIETNRTLVVAPDPTYIYIGAER